MRDGPCQSSAAVSDINVTVLQRFLKHHRNLGYRGYIRVEKEFF